MFQRFIDLSIPLENGCFSDPPFMLPKIEYKDHKETLPQMIDCFPGLAAEQLPDGEAWAIEHVQLSTHNGTHLDAPYHYASTMDNGIPSTTIDHISLDFCFKPGVKLNFTALPNGYVVTPDDIKKELERIEYTLSPLDIVLVNTQAGQHHGTSKYLSSGCGMGRDATLYLLEQGVKITGTDAWSWDAPFSYTADRFSKTKDPSIIWEGHKAGRERSYYHLEKLTNLELLPSYGFYICCFPIKIKNASAGWTRAVALL